MAATTEKTKSIALIAHDNKKPELIAWVRSRIKIISRHKLSATGTTGALLEEKLGLKVKKYKSGPLGGDQQIGAQIAEGKIEAVIFFWDPLSPHPHDPDVKALIRIASVYDVPMACNRATADLMIQSL